MRIKIMCPICSKEAVTIQTQYGPRNSCCRLWSWGVAPLVDKGTHEARKRAHGAFDMLWKTNLMTRQDAYAWLAEAMGLPPEQCHMKEMDEATADLACRVATDYVDCQIEM